MLYIKQPAGPSRPALQVIPAAAPGPGGHCQWQTRSRRHGCQVDLAYSAGNTVEEMQLSRELGGPDSYTLHKTPSGQHNLDDLEGGVLETSEGKVTAQCSAEIMAMDINATMTRTPKTQKGRPWRNLKSGPLALTSASACGGLWPGLVDRWVGSLGSNNGAPDCDLLLVSKH
jgi:hypothetical protein